MANMLPAKEMLTAREMEELLQVDRSTIYRMAEDGRLPAIKVGKQWRFPAEEVESQFNLHLTPALPAPGSTMYSQQAGPSGKEGSELACLLPLECVQLIQDTFAELLGVMLVVTDMNGQPILQPSHSCGLFEAVSHEPHALQRCIQSWQDLAVKIDLEPQFSRSHLGLLCSRAMIRVGSELKGMVVAGCVAPSEWPPSSAEIEQMARDFGVSPELLVEQANNVYRLDTAQQQRVLVYLQRIANIVSHIVSERKRLVGRLEAIADLTTL